MIFYKGRCMDNIIIKDVIGNCVWHIDDEKTLTIEPIKGTNGLLEDYFRNKGWPWDSWALVIRKVIVENGVKTNRNACFMFKDMKKCRGFDVDALDVSMAENLNGMFFGCCSLTELGPLKGWNVGNVTTISRMFEMCRSVSGLKPLAGWKVSSVRDMYAAFFRCEGITDLSPLAGWDVSGVKNMGSMFACCTGIGTTAPLNNWKTGKVESMDHMFSDCAKLLDASVVKSWNVASLEGARGMFSNTLVQENPLDRMIPMTCPRDGEFVGWKKCREGKLAKLLIPADAKRSSAFDKKCRCDRAVVQDITDMDGNHAETAVSNKDVKFVYRKGETVCVPNFDEDRFNECAPGIHFFVNKADAVSYLYL